MENYSTNLTDKQCELLEKCLGVQKRKRKYPIRRIFDAIGYILKTGCQWRMLPKEYPKYNIVFYYFRKWTLNKTIQNLFDRLHEEYRIFQNRERTASLGIIDSCSLKIPFYVNKCKGIDGNKNVKGRKWHLIVDTFGVPMAIIVHEGNIHDSVGAIQVFESMKDKFPRMKKILADGGYRGEKVSNVAKDILGCKLEVVLRPNECPSKFKVVPKRWIVERTFAWLKNFRRLTMDYEYYPESSVSMIQLAFCFLMLNKTYK